MDIGAAQDLFGSSKKFCIDAKLQFETDAQRLAVNPVSFATITPERA
jgi:hypothetical protein